MTYVMSDIHGCLEPYMDAIALLGPDDQIYVLGDVLDRGEDGLRILQDIMIRDSVHMIKGNHEQMCLEMFWQLYGESSQGVRSRIIEEAVAVGDYGQGPTLYEFIRLVPKEQMAVIKYIESLPLFASVTAGGQSYLMAHAAIPAECITETDIEYYADEDTLLWGEHEFNTVREGAFCIVGHEPTCNIADAEPNRIYYNNGSYDVDCGVCFGGTLGVLCLDTLEALYF